MKGVFSSHRSRQPVDDGGRFRHPRPPDDGRSRRRESWLVHVLRMLVYGLTAGVFTYPLAIADAVLAAAGCAAVGAETGRHLARTRLRLPALLGLAGVLTAGLHVGLQQAIDGTWLASVLGAPDALRAAAVAGAGGTAWLAASALRASAARLPALAALEVGFIGVSFAQLVMAHRQGAINRPFELADPILSSGGDPTVAFFALGAGTAGVMIFLLLSERTASRALLHLAWVALLVALVFVGVERMGTPQPPSSADALGLRGEPEKKQARDKKGQQPQQGRPRSEELEFRDDYRSQGKQAPVAVVLLHDDYSPPSGLYYFRQGAFSQYNGRRLIRATRDGVDEDIATAFPAERRTVAQVPNAHGDRATLETTVGLLAEHTRPFGLEAPVALEPEPNPDPGRFRRMYRVTSASLTSDYYALLGAETGDPEWSEADRAFYTRFPDDPRYTRLAERILSEMEPSLREDPVARALAITTWLSREGIYSLKSKHADAEDPTAHFLFGNKTGYCVHFAHAGVFLMRALGLPSRVATGYVIDEAARQGGSAMLLTGANAHAWPEVYVEGAGWVVMDIAPERSLDPPPPPPDPDLQRLLAEMARGKRPLPRDGDHPFEPVVRRAKLWGTWLGRSLGVALLAALCMLYLVKAWRRLAPWLAGSRALPRVVYRAELDRMAEVRLRRERGESRERFAQRLRPVLPAFLELTSLHVAAAYGSRRGAERARIRDAARSTRRELRRAVPWWRRIVGVLIPWSWLSAR